MIPIGQLLAKFIEDRQLLILDGHNHPRGTRWEDEAKIHEVVCHRSTSLWVQHQEALKPSEVVQLAKGIRTNPKTREHLADARRITQRLSRLLTRTFFDLVKVQFPATFYRLWHSLK